MTKKEFKQKELGLSWEQQEEIEKKIKQNNKTLC
ncbi:hypothetical protein LCGC14_1871960 [marine sediment metagenome]|uniref:Uncharacterized protein n=1 Tax=marine sediment metagenome TaxID=412755 RepID=A0A0F9G4M6_9ZZZZ